MVAYELSLFSPMGGFAVGSTLADLQAAMPAQQVRQIHLLYYDDGTWSVVPTR
jgi:hypothetical protein